jgi:pyruvate/2-oxoglutarate dehydrogenase complex dihydrolipoamide dehydrogenase (E3) component
VTVDGRLRSVSNRRVFAMGDAAGGLQFTHVAGYHAGIVVRQAVLGLPAKATMRAMPRVTYTSPELAQVGLTEAEARAAHGAALTVLRADFAHNDRAIAGARGRGLVKVMVVRGRPVGASHRRPRGRRADRLLGAGDPGPAEAVGHRRHRAALSDAGRSVETRHGCLFFPETL